MNEQATDEIRDLTAEEMESVTGGWSAIPYAMRALSHYYNNQVKYELEIGPVEVQTIKTA